MNTTELARALRCAMAAARQAGALMRRNLDAPKRINQKARHDIKLELDVRAQRLIERALQKDFPDIAVLGEEGIVGDPGAAWRWVVDPIDGTVNFTRGIPHACVSIALQSREPGARHWDAYRTEIGVVYDPFLNEMWSARRGGKARLNNRTITVSTTQRLRDAVITMGFAKTRATVQRNLPIFDRLCRRVMKVRLMGSAALALTWTAAGRLDAYREEGICLWDIAAGGLILECAGGEFHRVPLSRRYTYRLLASNGRLRRHIEAVL
ncbi:MAG: inositol monophosphatase [Pedosphaera sp.]|nr:inositol monophosphatase [Pedosphaera sp.]MSU44114.1 inositol monophosphatase [Pedosphaera sp.]